ncbi:ATP-binding cassette domain-containing protein [Streptomyces sp. P38-E01]|uniref:ATP-binding cassette domain-containing protein n=1 Tax=Streptomyces tardus TaxID=2780544 RepID=A0A949JNE2_9ACTN|nr:ATP-binding cassette domain-containing protein [Streptomyces tardus]
MVGNSGTGTVGLTAPPQGGGAIEVRGLVKHFGPTRAVDGVDLTVAEASVHGVLGPNGAGKTTLVRCLSSLLVPDGGTAHVAGYDVVRHPRQLRRVIGLTGQYASVDEKLSGWENLYMIGRLLDLSRKDARRRAYAMLERFSLTEAAKRPAAQYSGGMRRRLDLAASMIGRPQVLYLDEPTTGLDPRTRIEVWEEVKRMTSEGTTVLLTTQYMEEAEQLASDLTVIDRGLVIAEGRVAELKAKVGGRTLRIEPLVKDEIHHVLGALAQSGIVGAADATLDLDEGVVQVPIVGDDQLTQVIGLVGHYGFRLSNISTQLPSLDEVFLALTGRKTSPRQEDAPGAAPPPPHHPGPGPAHHPAPQYGQGGPHGQYGQGGQPGQGGTYGQAPGQHGQHGGQYGQSGHHGGQYGAQGGQHDGQAAQFGGAPGGPASYDHGGRGGGQGPQDSLQGIGI